MCAVEPLYEFPEHRGLETLIQHKALISNSSLRAFFFLRNEGDDITNRLPVTAAESQLPLARRDPGYSGLKGSGFTKTSKKHCRLSC
ncbi:uncharacterized [Tachysurus ichikawai]